MSAKTVRFYILGQRAVVIESRASLNLSCQQKIWWLAQQLKSNSAVVDVIIGMNNLTVLLSRSYHSPEKFLSELKELWLRSRTVKPRSREIFIPVKYGGDEGPDLESVASKNGLTPAEVILMHTSATYIVFFLGFQPGFAYMGGLPQKIATPRRAEPRLMVPAGSVGIGGSQTGVYPTDSPGGWNIIGRTKLSLFNPKNSKPTLLHPGDTVKFVAEEKR